MTESFVPVRDRTYRIVHPASADALIDEQDFDENERLPYWADIWPSALALARRIAGIDLLGKHAVELGCGVGLPAIVALERGGDVLATDHYQAALDFAAYNARTNLGKELETECLDWRTPPEELPRFDLVIAADVLYDKMNVEPLASLVPRLLVSGGELLLADPRRDYAATFLEKMERRGFGHSAEGVIVERDDVDVKVMLHRLWRERREA